MKKEKKNFFVLNRKLFTKKYLVVIAIILLIVVAGVIYLQRNKQTLRDVITVDLKDVRKTVLASGKVVSDTDLNLSFQSGDIVKSINVNVGDKVKAGQILATLANASEQAEVTRANGVLLGASAKYRKLLEGAGDADIIAAEDALRNAERTQDRLVDNAKRTLYSDGLIAEILRTDMDQSKAPIISGFYSGEEGVYNLNFKQSATNLEYSGIERGYIPILSIQQSFGSKGLYISFPVTSYSFNDEWVVKIPNKNGRNYTANLNAYNSALANREEIVSSAKSKLTLLKTKARQADLDSAQADIQIAKAGVASAQAILEKKILRAPTSGTITKIDIKLGDMVTPNVGVITLQDVSNLYVESNVNESDIIGVRVGQPVEINFEALGKNRVYNGELSLVDLGATSNDTVVNYKVKVLLKDYTDIRSGMTADLKIITSDAKQSIAIPSRYIGESNGSKYVYIVSDEKKALTKIQNVVLGEKGDGGIVVIKEGLIPGDKIALIDETK